MNIYYLDRSPVLTPQLIDDSRLPSLLRDGVMALAHGLYSRNVINSRTYWSLVGDNDHRFLTSSTLGRNIRCHLTLLPWLTSYCENLIAELDFRFNDFSSTAEDFVWLVYEAANSSRGKALTCTAGFIHQEYFPAVPLPNLARNRKLGMDFSGCVDTVEAYQKYYFYRLLHSSEADPDKLHKWTHRPVPLFVQEYSEDFYKTNCISIANEAVA